MGVDQGRRKPMPKSTLAAVLLLACMIAVIVGMDLLFFRGAAMTVWRFFANVAVALIGLGVYMKFIAR